MGEGLHKSVHPLFSGRVWLLRSPLVQGTSASFPLASAAESGVQSVTDQQHQSQRTWGLQILVSAAILIKPAQSNI